jgi:hypothetical protein
MAILGPLSIADNYDDVFHERVLYIINAPAGQT